jgi:hypothetical protein
MATTTAAAFNQFKAALKLTGPQKLRVSARRDATAGYVKQAFPTTSDMPLSQTKLIGSAARDTIIRPIDDIDLLAVFENRDEVFERYRRDSRSFLYRVRDGLQAYSSVEVVGARGQAVRFFYKDAPHVDVAPVFKWREAGYALPDGRGGWLTTDPDEHARYFKARSEQLGTNAKPFVRIMKQWNRSHSKYLKSFHLEVMITNTFESLGSDSRDAAEKFFGWGKSHVRVTDPAGHSGDLSTYLTYSNRQSVLTNLESSRQRAASANAAELAGNHEEAIRLWRLVLGNEFPAYG